MKKNDIQAIVDGINAGLKIKRAKSQVTLGLMIEFLEKFPGDTLVSGLGTFHSYRGYYSDLAFDPINENRTAGDLLAQCKDAVGRKFEGWKGGEFLMSKDTPLWVAKEGEGFSDKVMAFDFSNGIISPILKPES